jgi:hypothetical protein
MHPPRNHIPCVQHLAAICPYDRLYALRPTSPRLQGELSGGHLINVHDVDLALVESPGLVSGLYVLRLQALRIGHGATSFRMHPTSICVHINRPCRPAHLLIHQLLTSTSSQRGEGQTRALFSGLGRLRRSFGFRHASIHRPRNRSWASAARNPSPALQRAARLDTSTVTIAAAISGTNTVTALM